MSGAEFDWPEEMPEGFFWVPEIGQDRYHTDSGHRLYPCSLFADLHGQQWAWSSLSGLGRFRSFASAYTALRAHVLAKRDHYRERDRLAGEADQANAELHNPELLLQPPEREERPWAKWTGIKWRDGGKLASAFEGLSWLADRQDRLLELDRLSAASRHEHRKQTLELVSQLEEIRQRLNGLGSASSFEGVRARVGSLEFAVSDLERKEGDRG